MQNNEKTTLIKFIALYVGSTLFLLIFLLGQYYIFQKELIFKNQQLKTRSDFLELSNKLKQLHFNNDEILIYPRFKNFNSSIYDIDKMPIFETFKGLKIDFEKPFLNIDNHLYFIHKSESYFLGVAYMVIQKEIPQEFISLKQNILIVFIFSFIFIIFISYFLSKMFLKPMRETIILLDNFIKDFTHELNTPISTIKANIELLENTALDEKITNKINRIKLASNTIVNIYEDMVFSIFGKEIITNNETLEVATIINERLKLFEVAISTKKISVVLAIDNSKIFMDKHKFCKVFDNLISNAIKYNKPHGVIDIKLIKNILKIKDSGEGLQTDEIDKMFNRFARFSKSVGGFGIGLNIVKIILNEYKIKILVESKKGIGTKVILKW